jgi:hypothetical protein
MSGCDIFGADNEFVEAALIFVCRGFSGGTTGCSSLKFLAIEHLEVVFSFGISIEPPSSVSAYFK